MKKNFIISLILISLIYAIFNFRYSLHNSTFFSKLYFSLLYKSSKDKVCLPLQNSIDNILNIKRDNISVSVLDYKGDLIAKNNPYKPLIPASNQKIITSAYFLDMLGPNHRLSTILAFDKVNKTFHLFGSGDPDISKSNIREITTKIIELYKLNDMDIANIILYEEPRKYWWPESWSYLNRRESYGAPITRIAVQSNSASSSLVDPVTYLKSELSFYLNLSNIPSNIKTSYETTSISLVDYQEVIRFNSAPLYSLITLSNSESHNFTAEILTKNALNDWSYESLDKKLKNWLRLSLISTDKFVFVDGSGLSRENRLTTYGISRLLYLMSKHRFAKYYISSFSLYGVRGTLHDREFDPNLSTQFLGKTGTLDKVKSLSGYLFKNQEKYFLSIISNNSLDNEYVVNQLISVISKNISCNN